MNDPIIGKHVRKRGRQHAPAPEADEHPLEYPRESLLSCMEELERAMASWRLWHAGARPED